MPEQSKITNYQAELKEFLLADTDLLPAFTAGIAVPKIYKGQARQAFVKKRLNIYKNNVFYSLGEALGKLYPVVKRLLGDDCFNMLARTYIQQYPPKEAAMTFYGKYFSEFIKFSEACSQLLYLSDVALLEWYCQLALHAKNRSSLDPIVLSDMSEDQLALLRLPLHPSVQFMVSDYPVEIIWQENQKVEPAEIVIGGSAKSYLLIYRQEFRVQVLSLQPLVYRLLRALDAGVSISDAWEVALDGGGDEGEFAGIFVYLLGLGVFSGLSGKVHCPKRPLFS